MTDPDARHIELQMTPEMMERMTPEALGRCISVYGVIQQLHNPATADPDARCPDCRQKAKPDPETGQCMNVGCIFARQLASPATRITNDWFDGIEREVTHGD